MASRCTAGHHKHLSLNTPGSFSFEQCGEISAQIICSQHLCNPYSPRESDKELHSYKIFAKVTFCSWGSSENRTRGFPSLKLSITETGTLQT